MSKCYPSKLGKLVRVLAGCAMGLMLAGGVRAAEMRLDGDINAVADLAIKSNGEDKIKLESGKVTVQQALSVEHVHIPTGTHMTIGDDQDIGGMTIWENGYVGLARTSTAARGILHLGAVNGLTVHDAHSKWLCWNSYMDYDSSANPPTSTWRYISDDAGVARSAALMTMEVFSNQFRIQTAIPGAQDAEATFTPGISIDTAGNVGIKKNDPTAALNVNGAIQLEPMSTAPRGNYLIYAGYDSELNSRTGSTLSGFGIWATDDGGNRTLISPHADPRLVDPHAQSSFANPAVALPFSMHHANPFIGKGEVVDMAKLVAYVEKKMQAELGAAAGKLVYVYDLPADKCKSEADKQVDELMEELSQTPPVKVALGKDGALPKEALEEVDEMRAVTRYVNVPKREIDFAAGKVVTRQEKRPKVEQVATGRKIRRLKADWNFEDGVLYRRPTVDDLDVDAVLKKRPQLPAWVRERMKGGGAGRNLSELIEELRGRIQANAAKPGQEKLAASASR